MSRKNRLLQAFLGGLGVLLFVMGILLPIETKDLTEQERQQAEGDFLTLSQGEVHYFLDGPAEGTPVVLIHGFSVPSYVWEPTSTALTEAGFQVLRFDLYGRGYSDRPEVAYNQVLFVQQLEEIVDELVSDRDIHLVGLSMGGPIAAAYAKQHPEKITSLTLIAPEAVRTSWVEILPMNIPVVGEYFMQVILAPLLLPRMQTEDFVQPENFPGWEERYREQLRFRGTGRALLSTIRNIPKQDPLAVYDQISAAAIPVLIIWGEQDQTISREDIHVVQEVIDGEQLEIIPLAGHLPHYEQAGAVNPLIVDFLKSPGR